MAKLPTPSGGWGEVTTEHGKQSTGGQTDRWGSPSLALLAQALVRVDVGFAAGACVRHILEVIDEAGDQTAAQITPELKTEEKKLRPEEKEQRLHTEPLAVPPFASTAHLPHEAAEETQDEVHQTDLVGDFGGDGLLAVGAHCLHRCTFKDLSLQHCDCGGCPRRDQDCGRVAPRARVGSWRVGSWWIVAHWWVRAWRRVETWKSQRGHRLSG